ncbi:hypothetical protein A1019T_00655 [Psychrobacter pasteurii]|uniref:Lipoprotein n=1 Tax=Psychrobacter pasteurii TaxID=1945520 RepID=A0A1R4EDY3_9GAMM|nr:hypothetical protein [Psychrobacter pasteurii]SJM36692.1 hypothetical protein A1019T_00655 [Psychrobacter pasteurii]
MTQLINSHNQAIPKITSKLLGILATCLLISACTPSATVDGQTGSNNVPDTTQNSSEQSKQTQILQQAKQIQGYLATDNYQALTPHIHPTKGVRFSMYAYVQQETDKVFSREQFATYLQQSRIKFTWGTKDGVGDLYITTLPDFLNSWVAAEQYDFKGATFNKFQGSSNSLNNLKEVYPNADFVEFYHSGKNPEYAGMDWRSMRLVFEEYQGKYYLVAIVNDQWTV